MEIATEIETVDIANFKWLQGKRIKVCSQARCAGHACSILHAMPLEHSIVTFRIEAGTSMLHSGSLESHSLRF